MSDRCDGTLTKVKRGKVAVRDFRRKKTDRVKAGKRYLAKAPGRVKRRNLALAAALTTLAGAPAADAASLPQAGSWGSLGAADGQFTNLRDVAAGPFGDVYTIEDGGTASNRMQRFDANGAFLGKWGSEGSGSSQFQDGWGVAVSASGEVFAVDAFNQDVQVFSREGAFNSQWGTAGTGAGQFSNPEGIAVFGTNTVVVADRGNSEVDVYSATGAPVTEFGSAGSGPGQFNRLIGVAVNSAGDVFAVDRDNYRVQQFTASGTFVRSFGSQGTGPGQLQQPADVAVESDGDVWVADLAAGNIEKFTADGTYAATYDTVGTLVFSPIGLSFGPTGDLYIADVHPSQGSRILVGRESGAAQPPTGLPAPVLGVSVNVAPVSGTVRIGLPPGSASASQKGVTFAPLTEARQIPVGSFLDTKKGTVRLTSATDAAGNTQFGNFGKGLFQVLQSRSASAKGLTQLRLKGSSFNNCRVAARGKRQGEARVGRRPQAAQEQDRPPPPGQRRRQVPEPRPPQLGNRSGHGLDHERPLRRHPDQGQARQGRRARLPRKKTIVVKAGKRYLAKAPGA